MMAAETVNMQVTCLAELSRNVRDFGRGLRGAKKFGGSYVRVLTAKLRRTGCKPIGLTFLDMLCSTWVSIRAAFQKGVGDTSRVQTEVGCEKRSCSQLKAQDKTQVRCTKT